MYACVCKYALMSSHVCMCCEVTTLRETDNLDKVWYVCLKWNYIILHMGHFLHYFYFEINNYIVSFKISNCFSFDMLHNYIAILKSWGRLIKCSFPPLFLEYKQITGKSSIRRCLEQQWWRRMKINPKYLCISIDEIFSSGTFF